MNKKLTLLYVFVCVIILSGMIFVFQDSSSSELNPDEVISGHSDAMENVNSAHINIETKIVNERNVLTRSEEYTKQGDMYLAEYKYDNGNTKTVFENETGSYRVYENRLEPESKYSLRKKFFSPPIEKQKIENATVKSRNNSTVLYEIDEPASNILQGDDVRGNATGTVRVRNDGLIVFYRIEIDVSNPSQSQYPNEYELEYRLTGINETEVSHPNEN